MNNFKFSNLHSFKKSIQEISDKCLSSNSNGKNLVDYYVVNVGHTFAHFPLNNFCGWFGTTAFLGELKDFDEGFFTYYI
jgi:hypothetical protein